MKFRGDLSLGAWSAVAFWAVACGQTPAPSVPATPQKHPTELVTPPAVPELRPSAEESAPAPRLRPAPRPESAPPPITPAPVRPAPAPVVPPVTGPTTPAPAAPSDAAIPVKWMPVATLEVKKHTDKLAHIEVGVEGRVKGGKVQCELVDPGTRAEAHSKWLPLRLNIFNPGDPKKKLAKALHETLDFPNDQKKQTATELTTLVEFVRGRIFRAMWQVKARKIEENGKPACTAQLEICLYPEKRDGIYSCTRGWRQILRLITVIDYKMYAFYLGKPEREKNDIYEMLFSLKKIENGVPAGEAFEETFRDFAEE